MTGVQVGEESLDDPRVADPAPVTLASFEQPFVFVPARGEHHARTHTHARARACVRTTHTKGYNTNVRRHVHTHRGPTWGGAGAHVLIYTHRGPTWGGRGGRMRAHPHVPRAHMGRGGRMRAHLHRAHMGRGGRVRAHPHVLRAHMGGRGSATSKASPGVRAGVRMVPAHAMRRRDRAARACSVQQCSSERQHERAQHAHRLTR